MAIKLELVLVCVFPQAGHRRWHFGQIERNVGNGRIEIIIIDYYTPQRSIETTRTGLISVAAPNNTSNQVRLNRKCIEGIRMATKFEASACNQALQYASQFSLTLIKLFLKMCELKPFMLGHRGKFVGYYESASDALDGILDQGLVDTLVWTSPTDSGWDDDAIYKALKGDLQGRTTTLQKFSHIYHGHLDIAPMVARKIVEEKNFINGA